MNIYDKNKNQIEKENIFFTEFGVIFVLYCSLKIKIIKLEQFRATWSQFLAN